MLPFQLFFLFEDFLNSLLVLISLFVEFFDFWHQAFFLFFDRLTQGSCEHLEIGLLGALNFYHFLSLVSKRLRLLVDFRNDLFDRVTRQNFDNLLSKIFVALRVQVLIRLSSLINHSLVDWNLIQSLQILK